MSRAAARASGIALVLWAGAAALVVSGAGCAGAKHAKISGPPPEYEAPEPFDAGPAPAAESRPDAAAPSRPDGAPR